MILTGFSSIFTRIQKGRGLGSEEETIKALSLALIDRDTRLKIADIGSGTGASALLLSRLLDAQVTAIDLFQDFLEVLEIRAEKMGLSEKISTIVCSMDKLPFGNEELDVIWSEGAIYNIGFEQGVKNWRQYLKTGGFLVVSEIIWTTESRPSELQKYWEGEYPEINTASSKIAVLEKNGYSPMGYFVVPESCWLENYYQPLQDSFAEFLDRNANTEEAKTIVKEGMKEVSFYGENKKYYSYGFFIAKKLG